MTTITYDPTAQVYELVADDGAHLGCFDTYAAASERAPAWYQVRGTDPDGGPDFVDEAPDSHTARDIKVTAEARGYRNVHIVRCPNRDV